MASDFEVLRSRRIKNLFEVLLASKHFEARMSSKHFEALRSKNVFEALRSQKAFFLLRLSAWPIPDRGDFIWLRSTSKSEAILSSSTLSLAHPWQGRIRHFEVRLASKCFEAYLTSKCFEVQWSLPCQGWARLKIEEFRMHFNFEVLRSHSCFAVLRSQTRNHRVSLSKWTCFNIILNYIYNMESQAY